MNGFLVAVLTSLSMSYLFVAAFVCLLTALELYAPREGALDVRDRLRLIGFNFAYIPAALVTSVLVSSALRGYGVRPLFPGLGVIGVIAGAIAGDFLYYWYHRAQHSVPWLWRIHSTHHAVEKMGAGAGYHHLLDAPLKTVLVVIPAGLLFGGAGMAAVLFTLHGFYVHSTARPNFGRFAWIICDNRVHRVHHSRSPDHFNRNFGVITLLWDRLFGTAYFPKPEEWPEVGLDDHQEPKTFMAWLSLAAPYRNAAARNVAARAR